QFVDVWSEWRESTGDVVAADESTQRRITAYRDPRSGVTARLESVEYRDFAAIEWTLFLRNDGSADTPIIEDIQAIDADFERTLNREFILHHAVGSLALASDYAPKETTLKRNQHLRVTTVGGRS